jgi:hypothetical protein
MTRVSALAPPEAFSGIELITDLKQGELRVCWCLPSTDVPLCEDAELRRQASLESDVSNG